MIDKMLSNPWLWDLSRHFLDLTCGLYRRRKSFLEGTGLLKDGPSVLDVGCGTGLFAEITQGHYVGIDSDPHSIELAKKKRYKGKKIFRHIGLDALKKEKASFDIILIVDVLHHLNEEECIGLLKTIAKMTGKYLISYEPVVLEKMTYLQKWLRGLDKGKYFRHLDDYNKLFQSSGYKIIESHYLPMGFLGHEPVSICCLNADIAKDSQ